jgi:hypothetical protein
MACKLLLNSTLVKLVQSLKAELPIVVTYGGIVICFNAKAL